MLSNKISSYLLLTVLTVVSTQAHPEQKLSDKTNHSEQMTERASIEINTELSPVDILTGDQLSEVESDYDPTKSRKMFRRKSRSTLATTLRGDDELLPIKTDTKLSNTPTLSRYSRPVYLPDATSRVMPTTTNNSPLPYTSFIHSKGGPKFLSIIVSTRFWTKETVGGAMAKILDLVGYSLISEGMMTDPEATEILYKRLPKIHLNMDNISVIDALTTIAGPSYTVVFDHRIRRTTLDVSPQRRVLNRAQRLNVRLQ